MREGASNTAIAVSGPQKFLREGGSRPSTTVLVAPRAGGTHLLSTQPLGPVPTASRIPPIPFPQVSNPNWLQCLPYQRFARAARTRIHTPCGQPPQSGAREKNVGV